MALLPLESGAAVAAPAAACCTIRPGRPALAARCSCAGVYNVRPDADREPSAEAPLSAAFAFFFRPNGLIQLRVDASAGGAASCARSTPAKEDSASASVNDLERRPRPGSSGQA